MVRDRANDGANQVINNSLFPPRLCNFSHINIFFQYGDEGGVTYNRNPYSDYTDYQPVNTAYKVLSNNLYIDEFSI